MRVVALAVAGLLAACAVDAPNARCAPTPLGLPSSPVAEARARADADRSTATPGTPSPFVVDPAIRSLYGFDTYTEPAAAPAAADAQGAAGAASPAGGDAAAYVPMAAWPTPRPREPFVPFGTILGAGVGGALSTRSHRAEGALLGAGIGLLFDLQRTVR